MGEPDAIHFVNEAYKHCKALSFDGAGIDLLNVSAIGKKNKNEGKKKEKFISEGVLVNRNVKDFINAIARHRFWERELKGKVPG